jgi:hypothetical protein
MAWQTRQACCVAARAFAQRALAAIVRELVAVAEARVAAITDACAKHAAPGPILSIAIDGILVQHAVTIVVLAVAELDGNVARACRASFHRIRSRIPLRGQQGGIVRLACSERQEQRHPGPWSQVCAHRAGNAATQL